MIAASANHIQFSKAASDNGMGGAIAASTIFHFFILVVLSVGLPFLPDQEIISSTPISIEVVDVTEVAQTTNVAPPQNALEKPQEQPPEPSKPPTPTMTADTPPDLSRPAPPDIEETSEIREVAPPEPIVRKPVKKPSPPKKEEKPEQTKVARPEQKEEFASLLKNLTPDSGLQGQDQEAVEPEAENPVPNVAQLAELADRLTMSEQDMLRRQLSQCWHVLSGAKYAENLAVELRVHMNPDRTVRQAKVINQLRYSADPPFRAAADAALRALRNPKCVPLDLPKGKFELWKSFVIRFDPQDML